MIVLPWYIRFGVDCVLISLPLWYFNSTFTNIQDIHQLIPYNISKKREGSNVEKVNINKIIDFSQVRL